eukprot:1473564-Amphidinium_carterae.1
MGLPRWYEALHPAVDKASKWNTMAHILSCDCLRGHHPWCGWRALRGERPSSYSMPLLVKKTWRMHWSPDQHKSPPSQSKTMNMILIHDGPKYSNTPNQCIPSKNVIMT